jgi:hypothetical protein
MMTTRLARSFTLAILATFGAAGDRNCRAEDPAPARVWLAERLKEFQEYRFEREGAVPAPLTMAPQSVLNWSNPERGTEQGALFVWTHEGRPQMIACAFEWKSLKHEFHSLCDDAIAASRRGEPIHRFGPGIEWLELPDAPAPARSRPLRLTQMRRLAERFRVFVGHKDWAQTRLLSQPVYRVPESPGPDGAVFVFVQGTDPECVLLVETSVADGWRYALARQTKFGLKAEIDGRVVWERDPNHRPAATPETPFLVLAQEPKSRAAPEEK